MNEARRFLVHGRVQGVGFRWSAVREASALGLAGWIANLPGGAVEVHAEGSVAALDELARWLRQGPPFARVERVEARTVAAEGLGGFSVRR